MFLNSHKVLGKIAWMAFYCRSARVKRYQDYKGHLFLLMSFYKIDIHPEMPLKQNKPEPASKSKKYVEACVRVEQAKVDFRLLSVGEETAESKASRNIATWLKVSQLCDRLDFVNFVACLCIFKATFAMESRLM
jgi:hypothetical protein